MTLFTRPAATLSTSEKTITGADSWMPEREGFAQRAPGQRRGVATGRDSPGWNRV
jgi:hypothetical protein